MSRCWEKVIGKKSTELDVEFRAWLDQKVGSMVKAVDLKWQKATPRPDLEAEIAKNPANFFAQIQLAHLMAKAGEKDQALAHAMQSTRLFPEFTGDGNGYELAALILNEKGDKEAAAAQLQKWVDAGGLDPNPAKKLADLDVELKHPEAAAKVLESFLYIAPQDIAIHNQLGAIDMEFETHRRRDPRIHGGAGDDAGGSRGLALQFGARLCAGASHERRQAGNHGGAGDRAGLQSRAEAIIATHG